MSGATVSTPKPVASMPKKIAPTPAVEPVSSNGGLSLEVEHNWESTSGSVIKARFISLENNNINLSMYGGRSEQTIPLARLSQKISELAKELKFFLVKTRRANFWLIKEKR